MIDADVAKVFPDARAVNQALRQLMQLMETVQGNRSVQPPPAKYRAESSGAPETFDFKPQRAKVSTSHMADEDEVDEAEVDDTESDEPDEDVDGVEEEEAETEEPPALDVDEEENSGE